MVAFADVPQVDFPGLDDNPLNISSTLEYTEDGFIERGSFILDGENFTYVQVTNQEGTIINIIGDKGTVEEIVIERDTVEMLDLNQLCEVGVMMDPQTFTYTGSTLVQDMQNATVFAVTTQILNTAISRHYPNHGLYSGLFSIALNLANAWHTWHSDIFRSYYYKVVVREFWPNDGTLSPYRDLVSVSYYRNSDFSGLIRNEHTIIYPIVDR